MALARSIARASIILVAFLALTGVPRHANADPKAPPGSGLGQLKVWVPVGVIHDNYWIYLNGHIVSAPPHHAPDAGSRNFVSVKTHDGWEIWTKDGLILRSIHDQGWDNRYDPYALSLASRDALHLFQADLTYGISN